MNTTFAPKGKHIIPRTLYHITDRQALEKIRQDGQLKVGAFADSSINQDAIFTFELQNLLQRWTQIKMGARHKNLLGKLLDLPRNDDVVLLKISTQNLDPDKLRIRSQNWYFHPEEKLPKSQIKKLHDYWDELGSMFYPAKVRKHIDFRDKLISKLFPKMATHNSEGFPATQAPLFKQTGDAIEYFYTDNIPLTDVIEIGHANREEFYDLDYTIKSKEFLMKLFEGQREQIAVEKTL